MSIQTGAPQAAIVMQSPPTANEVSSHLVPSAEREAPLGHSSLLSQQLLWSWDKGPGQGDFLPCQAALPSVKHVGTTTVLVASRKCTVTGRVASVTTGDCPDVAELGSDMSRYIGQQ